MQLYLCVISVSTNHKKTKIVIITSASTHGKNIFIILQLPITSFHYDFLRSSSIVVSPFTRSTYTILLYSARVLFLHGGQTKTEF